MAAVLSEMHHQAVGAGQFDQDCGGQRIGVGSSTRLPECCHMIDIDAQSSHYTSAIPIDDAGERFRNWSKFIDNSVVAEALLTEEGWAGQEGFPQCVMTFFPLSWQSSKLQLHRNIVKLTHSEGSIKIRPFQRHDDSTRSVEDPPVGV
jgi:hypothetical protein